MGKVKYLVKINILKIIFFIFLRDKKYNGGYYDIYKV